MTLCKHYLRYNVVIFLKVLSGECLGVVWGVGGVKHISSGCGLGRLQKVVAHTGEINLERVAEMS